MMVLRCVGDDNNTKDGGPDATQDAALSDVTATDAGNDSGSAFHVYAASFAGALVVSPVPYPQYVCSLLRFYGMK